MSFLKKSWSNRQSEYPNRRLMTQVAGNEHLFEVTREEGCVFDEGSAFDQQSMNDLESRVDGAFEQVADGSQKVGAAVVADSAKAVAWESIGAKPEAFPSVAHTHAATCAATLGTTWAGDAMGPWTQTIAVAGVLESDNPIVDVVLSGEAEADRKRLENWSIVSRITTQAGSITATCYDDVPTVAVPVQIKIVR